MGGVFINNNSNYAIFPLKMLDDDKYKNFSSKEFFLYMLLLNRVNISKTNSRHFSDKNGVFVYYSNAQITKHLRCDKTTSVKVLNTLEQAGLIRKEYQRRGLPLKIYVNDIRAGDKNAGYSASKTPQDKFSQKPYNNSNYNSKPHKSNSAPQEKQVSFNTEITLTQMQKNRRNFADKKRKKTGNYSQSS